MYEASLFIHTEVYNIYSEAPGGGGGGRISDGRGKQPARLWTAATSYHGPARPATDHVVEVGAHLVLAQDHHVLDGVDGQQVLGAAPPDGDQGDPYSEVIETRC